jgi:Rieske Fe-S protein
MASAPGVQRRGRRGFIKAVTGWLGAALGALVAVPGLGFLAHPLRRDTVRGGKTPVRVAGADELKPDVPLRCDVRGELLDAWSRIPDVKLGSCWLVKSEADGAVRAFSTVCPHLGCGIDWNKDKRQFVCPCHQSLFALDGRLVSGPSPRDLDELDVIPEASQLKVIYRRYRVGTAKKVEV